MTFDKTKPVQTRDGRPARIICTDQKGNAPIVALIYQDKDGGYEVPGEYDSGGLFQGFSGDDSSDFDLVAVPETREVEVFLREDGEVTLCLGNVVGNLASKKVKFTIGEFEE